MRIVFFRLVIAIVAAAATGPVFAQAEVDRLLVKVNGVAITQSDLRQARALKLVSDTSSDAAIQHALENRLLMIADVNRLAPATAVSDEDLAERRQRWQAAVGTSADDLLNRYGMSRSTLDAWLRDDARVGAYVKDTFGDQNDPARARAAAAWVDRLRQRAGLR